jgi:hypothetical protein
MWHGKKIFTLLVVLIFLTTVFTCVSIPGQKNEVEKIEKIYYFEKPIISKVTINGIIFDRISMSKASNDGDIGSPSLPFYDIRLLLPMGTVINSVSVVPGKEISLGTGYNLEPIPEPVKISEINKISTKQKTYDVNFKDTKTIIEINGLYNFRGYSIYYFNLYPINYYSEDKELTYFENIKVVINLNENENANTLYRGKQVDEKEVLKKIDNVEMISTYKQNILPTSECYNLLILTTNDFYNNFLPLEDAHNFRGLKTKIKTLNSSESPEEIRDLIKNEYINYGIEYVLIGGDNDTIPSKMLWVQAWQGADQTIMPVDMYYGCLDGTFNYDEDELWGEPTDGTNGGDVDLLAEVYIGRAPVGNGEEADNFVNKTILQMNTDYSSGNSLLIGELLYTDPYTWGGDYMDQLVDLCKKNSYTTNGIPSNKYNIEKLYDKNDPNYNWPVTDLINLINDGVKMVNHLGHSYYGYNMKMTNDDVSLLTNSEPFFVYSQGCMAGGFDDPDGYDCIAEYLTVKTNHAAFAAIMCARYGWFRTGSTDGPSQRFHRQFVDAIFGENISEIGKANQDSKEDNIKIINGGCIRWCYYETNLLGDPTLTFNNFENNPPSKPKKPVGERNGNINSSYNFSTLSYDQDNDTLYFRFEWGDGNSSAWVGPYNSSQQVTISYSWSKIGTYYVKVKARDEHCAMSSWSESLIVTITKNKGASLNLFDTLKSRYTNFLYLFFKFWV